MGLCEMLVSLDIFKEVRMFFYCNVFKLADNEFSIFILMTNHTNMHCLTRNPIIAGNMIYVGAFNNYMCLILFSCLKSGSR